MTTTSLEGDLDVTVVVPSHARPLRVRWLLNALEEQTLPAERWELIVVHDYDDGDTRNIFDRHPLSQRGSLRQVRIPPGNGSAAKQRNLGWRAARAPLVAFTDDDCRPDAAWLQELVSVARRHRGAIVQGRTESDPIEVDLYASPHYRTVYELHPPGPFAQTCNILYPRDLLERVRGFDEAIRAPAGEDLELSLRCRAAGAGYVGAPEAVVFHCVEGYSLVGALRLAAKWEEIVLLAKRHPEVRDGFPLRVFWRATHARLMLALLGLAFTKRAPLVAVAASGPYVRYALGQRGTHLSARIATTVELPGRVIVDLAELAFLVRGSIRHRTLVL